ncbi:MAG TPA: hypothetical protein IAB06_03835 [Candidatus Avacidaminococcus intestinavium]|uniref:Uncharacterized protein n=1 Tax=Candidatus Avacidaminococcus intestinavium TaxID=2840684 RepID=A0A9D1MQ00_9FIRM|nr:hypothetical protein [Candidatus Avacidaminococcus intestinavium]
MDTLANEFIQTGFWEDLTEEENITIFGMDFPTQNAYIIITDSDGRTPLTSSSSLVVAAYDLDDCFLWAKEIADYPSLKELLNLYPAQSIELFQNLKNYSLPKK